MSKRVKDFRFRQDGITLIEVLIAVFIMAVIATISYQALSASIASKEVVEDNLKKLSKIDRVWMLVEGDLRNVLSHSKRQTYGPGSGGEIPPLFIESASGGEEYWLNILRGGYANPLSFQRTEVIRVGYRVNDEALWRDVWYDLASVDVDQARQQKVIDGVENIEVRILPRQASSFSAGPWVDRWPQQQQQQQDEAATTSELPLAVEITLEVKGYQEIKRLYSLVKGES